MEWLNRKKSLIDQITEGPFDAQKYGSDMKKHMTEDDYRRTRFSEELGIRYKDMIDLLKSGNFEVDAVLQEKTNDNLGHLVIAIRRNDTDTYHQKYAIMVLNKAGSTFFPPSETIIDYINDKLRDGNFAGCMHFMNADLRGAYSNLIRNKGDMSKVFDIEKNNVGQRTKQAVIEIANQLKS